MSREWFEELLDPENSFPLSMEEKDELLIYVVVVAEIVWIERNKLVHGGGSSN